MSEGVVAITALIWLRAETKPFEQRSPLTPDAAARLVDAGFQVCVEAAPQRCFDDASYREFGCRIVETGSWPTAPREAFVLGLKELPDDDTPLTQNHIYFAHAYKQQTGWQDVLRRFKRGQGRLYDLEFLVDETGRRIAAFGYWAGYAGAALAIEAWCGQQKGKTPPLDPITASSDRGSLQENLKAALAQAARRPRVIVLGALGRSGRGAGDCAAELDLETERWDLEETRAGGPFPKILDHEIFINCVLLTEPIPPFITPEGINRPGRQLTVISDVSCDPNSAANPVPLYDQATTFDRPSLRILAGETPLDLIAIDHLPSLVPKEASEEFSGQLLPALLCLADLSDADGPQDGVWQRALQIFEEKSRGL